MSIDNRYDVVIAGARCAGASAAMLLARRGLKVLVVDPLPRGRDTLSTHALMRGGVLQLHRWGLLDAVRAAGTPAITATTFDYADDSITIPIKPADGVDALYAPRRTVLDPILAGAAEEAGAHVVHGLSVVDLERDAAGRVRGAVVAGADRVSTTVHADLVVGADGVRSRVARLVDAPFVDIAHHAAANVFGYWQGLDDSGFRWAFRPRTAIGTIPTNDEATCVFVSVEPRVLEAALAGDGGIEALFEETVGRVDPGLLEGLRAGRRVGKLRAFAGLPGFLRASAGPGWALVGDAGYFKDPLTAHGITDALRDAELLARAVVEGRTLAEDADEPLGRYTAERDRIARGLMEVTDRIASLAWDGDEVKALHRRLSDEMKLDLETIRSFDGATPRRRRSA